MTAINEQISISDSASIREGIKLATSSAQAPVLQANQANQANPANPANAFAADKAVNIIKSEGQQQLTEKVRWMVNARNPSAEIRLDPPDLGSMQIKVNMNGDNAQVSFTVQSATAKEALDKVCGKDGYLVVEIDKLPNCSVIQDVLKEMTGARSVSHVYWFNIFI